MSHRTPLLLGIDTATRHTSVALVSGGDVLAASGGTRAAAHTTQLLRCVDDVLKAAGVTLGDLDALAATVGPGTFTGLRTGLATVKAFASALGIPVAPVPTLHAVAKAEGTLHVCVKALLHAGRSEVFAQSFAWGATGALGELDAPRHISPRTLLDQTDAEDVLWVGDGARAYIDLLRERATQRGLRFTDVNEAADAGDDGGGIARGWRVAAPCAAPLAVAVASLASEFVRNGELVSAENLRALYVRLSDAEIKERTGK